MQVARVQVPVHRHGRAGVAGGQGGAQAVGAGGGLGLTLRVQHDGGPRGVLEQRRGRVGGGPHLARGRRHPVEHLGDPGGVEGVGSRVTEQGAPGQAGDVPQEQRAPLGGRQQVRDGHAGRARRAQPRGDGLGGGRGQHLEVGAGAGEARVRGVEGDHRPLPGPVAAPGEADSARGRAQQGGQAGVVLREREPGQGGVGGGPPPEGAVLEDAALARPRRAGRCGVGTGPRVAGQDEGAGADPGVAGAPLHDVHVQHARGPTSPLQVQGVGSGAQPAQAGGADGEGRGGAPDAHGRARRTTVRRRGAGPGRGPGPGRRRPARRWR